MVKVFDDSQLKSLAPTFSSIESQLEASSGAFLLGDEMSFIDISFYGMLKMAKRITF